MKCRATRRPALRFTAFAGRIILRMRAHVNQRPRAGEEGDAQHFNEVKDERARVHGHGNPARREACVRALVEAAIARYGVVLVQVVAGLLRRREAAEDCWGAW